MKRWIKKCTAFLLACLITVSLFHDKGRSILEGVYLSAANDQLLELTEDTMPFYSGGQLYISNHFFMGTDLGVHYVRNRSMGLALLYTNKTDLRFDLVNLTIYDKDGKNYSGRAIEKNGIVFFPIDLVCQFFGLTYSVTATSTAPLVRVTSATAILSDRRFIDAATSQMTARYEAYEKKYTESTQNSEPSKPPVVEPLNPPVVEPPNPPVIQAQSGQMVFLILSGTSREEIQAAMDRMGDSKATFLLTVQQMEDGDMVRSLLGRGHGLALRIQSETEDEILNELNRARTLVWNASMTLLQLVWYEGDFDISGLLAGQGCIALKAEIDRRDIPVRSAKRAEALLSVIGRYREDVSVYLGTDAECKDGLKHLVSILEKAKYHLSFWRLTAYQA